MTAAKGSFNNYVDQSQPSFDHLPPLSGQLWTFYIHMPFVHDDPGWTFLDIKPPLLVHVVIECPQSPGTAAVSCLNPAAALSPSIITQGKRKAKQRPFFLLSKTKHSASHLHCNLMDF